MQLPRQNPLTLLLFLLFLLLLLLFFQTTRHRKTPNRQHPCISKTFMIGYSHTPQTLSQFLRQFPLSTPPKDLCIIFLTIEQASHTHFSIPNLDLLHPPSTLYTAYTQALRHATNILVADDDTVFHTTRYGTGKNDVASNAHSFNDLLTTPSIIRHAPPGVINSAAVLTHQIVLERTLSLHHLHRTGGRPETIFENLNTTKSQPLEPFITTLLPITPDVRASHKKLQPSFSISLVKHYDDHNPPLKGLYHPPGSFGRVAKPAIFERHASWLLPFDNTISGYVIQRALWENGSGVLVVPNLDRWPTNVEHDDDRIDGVINFLDTTQIPNRLRFIDEVFTYLLEGLVKARLIHSDILVTVRVFHNQLRRRGVARLLRRGSYQTFGRPTVGTAVCVTGQMRSAGFTARNILEVLEEGILGGFDVFVVTERDDRSSAARLFNATAVRYSSGNVVHEEWIRSVRKLSILHETMSTEREVRNYLKQLWDLRECGRMVSEREYEQGREYRWMVRIRPDIMFMKPVYSKWWTSGRRVVYGKRHSYYAMNDRFFAGDRTLMGRLMACHDLFAWVLSTGRVYHRRAGDATHMLFKKEINCERFLARCAAWKKVALKGVNGIDVRRVAFSDGVAKWREF